MTLDKMSSSRRNLVFSLNPSSSLLFVLLFRVSAASILYRIIGPADPAKDGGKRFTAEHRVSTSEILSDADLKRIFVEKHTQSNSGGKLYNRFFDISDVDGLRIEKKTKSSSDASTNSSTSKQIQKKQEDRILEYAIHRKRGSASDIFESLSSMIFDNQSSGSMIAGNETSSDTDKSDLSAELSCAWQVQLYLNFGICIRNRDITYIKIGIVILGLTLVLYFSGILLYPVDSSDGRSNIMKKRMKSKSKNSTKNSRSNQSSQEEIGEEQTTGEEQQDGDSGDHSDYTDLIDSDVDLPRSVSGSPSGSHRGDENILKSVRRRLFCGRGSDASMIGSGSSGGGSQVSNTMSTGGKIMKSVMKTMKSMKKASPTLSKESSTRAPSSRPASQGRKKMGGLPTTGSKGTSSSSNPNPSPISIGSLLSSSLPSSPTNSSNSSVWGRRRKAIMERARLKVEGFGLKSINGSYANANAKSVLQFTRKAPKSAIKEIKEVLGSNSGNAAFISALDDSSTITYSLEQKPGRKWELYINVDGIRKQYGAAVILHEDPRECTQWMTKNKANDKLEILMDGVEIG